MEKINRFFWFLFFVVFSVLNAGIFSDYPDLKLFGEDFFENFKLETKRYQIPVSDDYIVGPGDIIVINVWGFFESEYQKEVEIDGSIFVQGIGKIYIGNKKFSEAKKIIEDKFYKKYKNIQVSVSIGKIKTINVFVLGEVNKPGVYEISPFFTILDIISIAGGVNKNGSLRKIEIIKSNGEREIIDIYPLLLKGEKVKIFQFQNEDTIFINKSENLVGIVGAIRKPAIYELKKMEIGEIIELCGGFLPNADISHIQIERIDKEKGKILIDLKENEINTFRLKNFDIIKIPEIPSQSYYQVEVLGSVKKQRVYGWKEGIKISDILKEEDLLPFSEKEKGEIVRIENGYRKIIKFSPEKVFSGDEKENLYLMPLDKIIIYSKERPEKSVFIYGEVNFPGAYIIESGEKLSNIIKRAGNFTDKAYPKGIVFLRETIKKQKEKEIVNYVKEKMEILKSALKTTTDTEEKQVIEKGIISLEKLSEIEPTGRIIIKIDKLENFENSLYDIELENGDIIYVPKKPVYVSIIGEVNNPKNVFYEESLSFNDYIQKVGGFTKDADRKGVFIVRVDGSSDKNLEKIEPGDTIVVPFEPKGERMRFIKDIMQIFYQIAVGVGVLIK
jgi:protein involved in polysaccharide export with SLBB domain